jgi:[ribosomal protein S5]-alanine N-acetyltransferase
MSAIFDFSSFPVLTTQRLHLRPLTHDDADDIIAIYGSPDVLRYLNIPPTDTVEKAIGLIDWFTNNYDSHDGVQWGFTLHGDNRLIGTGGTYAWDRENRHVDIGYHIVPTHWGNGYATEAAHAIIGWCFEHLDVNRVQADCTDGNMGSERVLLKCGFKVEGIWRESCWEHGRFVDIKQFGLLRREYRPQV